MRPLITSAIPWDHEYMTSVRGLLLVYDVNTSGSLGEVVRLLEDIYTRDADLNQRRPITLVANKCDATLERREVPEEDGRTVSRSWGLSELFFRNIS